MFPLHTVVCAVDFSRDSRQALRTAIALARAQPLHLVAVHVIDHAAAAFAPAGSRGDESRAEIASALEAFVAAEWPAPVACRYSTEVVVGVPEREVLAAASRARADLIVVGTRGLSGAAKTFFGSVAEKVLRRADVPVLAVPTREEDSAVRFARVLAAVDLDESAEGTAAAAAEIAGAFRVPLALVHAIVPLPGGWRWMEGAEAATTARVRRARARLEEIAAGLHVPFEIDVRVGPPALTVVTMAQEAGTLLVVGMDGDVPLMRLGSTAYRIVCASEAPVWAAPVRRAPSGERQQERTAAGASS